MLFVFIYWCIDDSMGKLYLKYFAFCEWVSSVLKLTFCVYRPWVYESRVIPNETWRLNTISYSMPSGHSTRATYTYLSAMKFFGKKLFLKILFASILAITLFSRLYLGMHTVQDVIVAVIVTVAVMKICQTTEEMNKIPEYTIMFSLLLITSMLAYVMLKQYPNEVINGVVMNGTKEKADIAPALGYVLGYVICDYINTKYIKHKATTSKKSVIMAIISLLPLLLYCKYGEVVCVMILGNVIGKIVTFIGWFIYVMVIIPAVLKTVS